MYISQLTTKVATELLLICIELLLLFILLEVINRFEVNSEFLFRYFVSQVTTALTLEINQLDLYGL